MKHDFRKEPIGQTADQFTDWLLAETTNALKRDYGDVEAVKSTMFMFVNRVCESHMPEKLIAQILGKSIAQAGYSEQEEGVLFDMYEMYEPVARKVHKDS
tara:strand:- start:669 stop:968 length:300 start_codon:yes stop_codon:yes gene_type:complete